MSSPDLRLEFVEHRRADAALVDEVCAIKDESWPHGMASQRAWIRAQLSGGDTHVLGRGPGGVLLAYLNLVPRAIRADATDRPALGVGNVCVRHVRKGAGLGSAFLRAVGDHLRASGTTGVLLCKDPLVPFYVRAGWQLIDRGRARAAFSLDGANVLVLPAPADAGLSAARELVLHGGAF